MAQTLFTISVHYNVPNLLTHGIFEPVTQHSIVNRALLKLFARESCRFAKRDDARNVFRAGTSLALLMSANVLSLKSHTTPDVKRSDTCRRVQLVARHREQIATKLLDI